MGGNTKRIINKIMVGVALASAPYPSTLIAKEKENHAETQTKDKKEKYWEIIKTAKDGGSVDINELREAIENIAAAAKGERYLDFASQEYKSVADDVYAVYYGGWKNKGSQDEVRVEFLKGMAIVDPKKAAREVENAINDKNKTIAIGAMEAAIYVDSKQAAVNILYRIFDDEPEIVNQAYKSLYMMKSTPDALPGVMNTTGKTDRLITYLDIVVNYYLITNDKKMANILLSGLENEKREEVIPYIVRAIEKTDILKSENVRKTALNRLLKGEYPDLMAEIYVESIKSACTEGPTLSSAEIDLAIAEINNEYERAKDKVRGNMNIVLAELYIARAFIGKDSQLPLQTFLDRINNGKGDEERVGAVKGLGRLLEWSANSNTRTEYLRVLLDIYKNEKENTHVRNAAAEGLGINAFDEAIGGFIENLENSNDVALREGTAKALYLYNERKRFTYNVGGIEKVTAKEIKRITDEEFAKKNGKGSGVVLNYLLIILGKTTYVEKTGSAVKEYNSTNFGIDKDGKQVQKPEKSIIPDEIKGMMEKADEEIKKAYAGILEYYGWLAKANLLTQEEANNLVAQVGTIYEYAKTKKGEERAELFKKIVFLSSALGTNYGNSSLGGVVAEILKETYVKEPDIAAYTLRILRGDIVKDGKGKVSGGLATTDSFLSVLKTLEELPSTSDAKGERTHIMMLINELIIGLMYRQVNIPVEREWPWEQRTVAVFRSTEALRRAIYGFDVLTDKPA